MKRIAGVSGTLFSSVGSRPLLTSEKVSLWPSNLTNSAPGWWKDQVNQSTSDEALKSSYLSRWAVGEEREGPCLLVFFFLKPDEEEVVDDLAAVSG